MADKALFDKTLNEFHNYLGKIVGVYQGLKPVIREQIEIIRKADIRALDENLKAQQVLVQKTKDFDGKVSDFIKRLGIEAKTLTEFIAEIPQSDQYRFYDLLGKFDAAVEEVSVYKQQCNILLEAKVYGIEKAIYKQGGPVGKTYEKDASKVEKLENNTSTFEINA